MQIIAKKDILSELQTKGIFQDLEKTESFLETFISEIAKSIRSGYRVCLENFGCFYSPSQKNTVKNADSFAENIAKAAFIDKEIVEKAISALVLLLKGKILENYEIQIEGFASLHIENPKKLANTAKKENKKVSVSQKKRLIASIEKNFLSKAEQEDVQFDPDADFRKKIEKLKFFSLLLVVPEQDFFVKTIEYYFEKANWKVRTASSIEEGKKILENHKHHLVILDSRVQNHQMFCEEIKCRLDSDIVPLIILYPKGTDLKKATEFRVCGDEHMIEPFEVKRLFQIAEAVLRRVAQESMLFRQEVLFQFPTMESYIDKANDFCAKLLLSCGLSEEIQITFGAAFREALANAAQHGNKYRRDKMLEVLYLLDPQKIVLSVTDSGPGFDWQGFVKVGQTGDAIGKARQSYKEGRLGGLGIMLMSRCVDKIEYNDSGNVITLTKYIEPKAQ